MENYNVPHSEDEYELKQRIWDKLKLRRTDVDPALRKRLAFKPNDMLYTTEYNNFIKELYPVNNEPFSSKFAPFAVRHCATKYNNINHERAFKRYMELPKPAPSFLPPTVLQTFIKRYVLSQRHFANRNVLEGCLLRGDTNGLLSAIRNENARRKDYLDRCQSILNDVKQAGFELTQQEQVRMIYLSYFKDRNDVVNVAGTDKGFGYKKFTFDDYQSLLSTFGDRRDLLGVLLFLATRHDQLDVICDILPKVGLGSIIGVEDKGHLKLTDISLINLFRYFNTFNERPEFMQYLANTIAKLNEIPVITTEIVDNLIIVLADLDLIKHAEILFETAYFSAGPSEGDDPVLTEWRYIYTKLKTVTNDKSVFYNLSPSHLSFSSLFHAYCLKGSFEKVKQLMYVMDNLTTLSMSTKMYFAVFKGFLNRSDWKIDDLQYILNSLLNQIDTIKDNDDLNSSRLLSILPQSGNTILQDQFVDEFITSDTTLRLSNLLMECIFMACINLLNQSGDPRKSGSIKIVKSRWEKMVEPKKSGPYEAERLSYINKAVLMDLVTIIA
ncbi:hypothetical protein KGF57_000772 [Candida theae]|uniref:Uncharacterized protein n=1 Tax=Candida theae TaxID=1198502 RepID=A0AAD5G0F6_9ASCO|nr:uncharacterized protein KGF57_000772 [Candida theae]KAI5965506.1 hypothetical protein KGF57_000772 [Candida theae]